LDSFDLHILVDASRERIGVLISDLLTLTVEGGDLSATSWRDLADWSGELAGITRAIADAAERRELL
jgi:hypothetical protein